MIPTNELRIGNWVKVGDIESTVCLIDHNSFVQLLGNAIVNRPEQIDPIPLTPEILDRCGLKNDDGYYHNEDYSFSLEERGNEYFYEYDGRNIGKGCKYLHQLQNLYFALTGEELEIKQLQES